MSEQDLVNRLRKRAEIRRQIQIRKSVQEGKPDRIADLLEEAAEEIERLRNKPVWSKYTLDELLSQCDLRGTVVNENDIVSPVTELKGLVNKQDSPDSIEDLKIQSMQSLKDEMFAVARGECKAPSDAGNTSFESGEAANRWKGRICPLCGVAMLVRGPRDMPYTYKGHSTVIRSIIGDFCPACTHLLFDLDEARRAMKLMREFENKVDRK